MPSDPLHAGYAAVVSLSRDAMQQVLHAAYVNDLIDPLVTTTLARTHSGPPQLDYVVDVRLFMAEPRISTAPGDTQAHVAIDLAGPLTFSAPGLPTLVVKMRYGLQLGMNVVIVQRSSGVLAFGLAPATATIQSLTATRIAGPDPEPVYGMDPADTALVQIFLMLAIQARPAMLITMPMLEQFVQLNLVIENPAVAGFEDGLTLGIDINGRTNIIGITGVIPDPSAVPDADGNLPPQPTVRIDRSAVGTWTLTRTDVQGTVTRETRATWAMVLLRLAELGAVQWPTGGFVDAGPATAGDVPALVDLNEASIEKGWSRTFSDALNLGDDEFGGPVYGTGWLPVVQRPTGPHHSDLAVYLHGALVAYIFDQIGRFEAVRLFEQWKCAKALARVEYLRNAYSRHYSVSGMGRTVINTVNIALVDGALHVTGSVTKYADVKLSTSFAFKVRLVRVVLDGSGTVFLSSNQGLNGFRGEIFDVEIDEPSVVTALKWAVAGLWPVVPGGVLLFVGLFTELLFAQLLPSLLRTAVGDLYDRLAGAIELVDDLSFNQGHVRFELPGTSSPQLVMSPNDFAIHGDVLSDDPELPFPLDYHGVGAWVDLRTNVTARLVVPVYWSALGDVNWSPYLSMPIEVRLIHDALFHPRDPTVRIRWTVFADSKANLLLTFDRAVNFSVGVTDPMHVDIDHASDALKGYERFIVQCRVYRPVADSLPAAEPTPASPGVGGALPVEAVTPPQELFQQELVIRIVDRLSRVHDYVSWKHRVHFRGFSAKKGDSTRKYTGWVSEDRRSQIHRTDPAVRCRFADQYTVPEDALDYTDELPFDIAGISANRHLVCEYCFFGGPDKTVLVE